MFAQRRKYFGNNNDIDIVDLIGDHTFYEGIYISWAIHFNPFIKSEFNPYLLKSSMISILMFRWRRFYWLANRRFHCKNVFLLNDKFSGELKTINNDTTLYFLLVSILETTISSPDN